MEGISDGNYERQLRLAAMRQSQDQHADSNVDDPFLFPASNEEEDNGLNGSDYVAMAMYNQEHPTSFTGGTG